jgi:hypothetical protein
VIVASLQPLQVLAAVPAVEGLDAPLKTRSPWLLYVPFGRNEMGAVSVPAQKSDAELATLTLSNLTTGVVESWLMKWLLALPPDWAKTALNAQLLDAAQAPPATASFTHIASASEMVFPVPGTNFVVLRKTLRPATLVGAPSGTV